MRLLFSILLIIITSATAIGQNLKNDLLLIEHKEFNYVVKDNNYRSEYNVNNKAPISLKHQSIISKYNPISIAASGAMLFYQYVVSPQFFRYCLYHRSCSNYSKKAIQEFGLFKGVFLSADRIMRCNIAAIMDFPQEDVSADGLIIDEPLKYHLKISKQKSQ
jgi:uncharacterized protein